MASSRPIAAGEQYTPDDINNLRSDVLDPAAGHNHGGSDGRKIAFNDLDVTGAAGSTAPSGGSKSYTDIANHVASSQGQHGLNGSVYVAGGNQAGVLVQAGTVVFTGATATITFPIPYSAAPAITLTGKGAMGGIGEYLGFVATSVSPTQAVVQKGTNEPNTAMWIAVGVKA